MIRIIVVDDQRLVRKCISAKLESVADFQVIAEADSGEQLRKIIRDVEFDVILLDLNMPGMGGLETTRWLLAHHPQYKIIGLSMYVEGPYPRRFLELGGAGYVSKDADTEELISAVREISEGRSYISRDVALNVAIATILPRNEGRVENLTQREIEVLQRISAGSSAEEIARQMSLSIKTIAYHRRHLMAKLGATNDVKLTLIARTQGLTDLATSEMRTAANEK
jgi:two-component system, NarL family, invasion response regulator UvrY